MEKKMYVTPLNGRFRLRDISRLKYSQPVSFTERAAHTHIHTHTHNLLTMVSGSSSYVNAKIKKK